MFAKENKVFQAELKIGIIIKKVKLKLSTDYEVWSLRLNDV